MSKKNNFLKFLFLGLFFDYTYNGLFEKIHYNGNITYYISVLYNTKPLHIFTSFLFIGAIWYGPILWGGYVLSLIYEEQCKKENKESIVFLSENLRPCGELYTNLLSIVLILTLIDWYLFMIGGDSVIWPDLIVYNTRVYHIIDGFLFFHAFWTRKAVNRLLQSKDTTVTGHTIYYSVLALILPPIAFSFPFVWAYPFHERYLLRWEYIDYVITMI
jgi:hypothetical protein